MLKEVSTRGLNPTAGVENLAPLKGLGFRIKKLKYGTSEDIRYKTEQGIASSPDLT